jgi:Family of unknown function (DUF6178)
MADSRPLLDRLLKTPDLAKIVPRLQPAILHRVIEHCGLEDCAELVALATPEQLTRVLDVDVWHAPAPGIDEALDADRFGLWIAVLMQSGPEVAAEKLLGLDIALVIAGLTRHAAVFDNAAVSSYTTTDGEHVPGRAAKQMAAEIGGYVLEARRTSAWEAIVDLIRFLAVEHAEYFHRLMRRCVRLSNGRREEDGFHNLLDDEKQDMFDLATGREARREEQGYVSPAQAQAFLKGARATRLNAAPPPRNPIAAAYFRNIEPAETTGEEVAGVVEILREAGVITPPPRGLLGPAEGHVTRLALVEAHVASNPQSAEELAYLVNAMMAGCSIQDRPFTAGEASDAAAAVCNLGLENWPARWPAADLIGAFQAGWAVLYRDVCIYAAKSLVTVLRSIQCTDRDIQLRLDGLRRELKRHIRNGEPWRVRNDLDVILMLDTASWAGLLGLIDECPVLHAAVGASRGSLRRIDPNDFAFVSQNIDLASVREFMTALPSLLTL